ncbi:MAG: hypothetical protein IJB96_12060 [Lachnospira sp.]|nr:hypothetical protein [Lachnospira sp.]
MDINQMKDYSGAVRQAAKRLHIMSQNMAENVDDESAKAKKEAKIRAKLEAGIPLTRKEMEFLRRYNPQLYAIALRVEIKRKALEERLSHAKSKSEVQDIQLEAMATIRKDDPAKRYMVAAVEYAMKEFKETSFYKKLPDTKEDAKKCRVKDADFEVKAEDEDENGELRVVYKCDAATGVGAYQIAYIDG